MDRIPTELLQKIFKYTSRKELNNVMLVCQRWKEVGEEIWSYADYRPIVKPSNLTILTFRRMKCIKKLRVVDDTFQERFTRKGYSDKHCYQEAFWKKALTLIGNLEKLECLELERLNLVDAPSDLLIALVKKLNILTLNQVTLNGNGEIWSILRKEMSNDDFDGFKNIKLALCGCTIDNDICAPIIGKVFNGFNNICIDNCEICPQFLQEFFKDMSKSTHLKEVRLVAVNVDTVEPSDFASALNNLHTLYLSDRLKHWKHGRDWKQWVPLSEKHVAEFFKQMSLSTKIRELTLKSRVFLDVGSLVEPSVFSHTINQLSKADISDIMLSNSQGMAVIKQAIIKTNLSSLKICLPDKMRQNERDLLVKLKRKILDCKIFVSG